ncbi:MAG: tol-pal system protein YbgF [Deltaproteobacteria bacterium]|nr:tol-pal system protein YbgF [Deltaproteobacteria bacterium]
MLLMLVGVALSACATPQQLELIEREQRRLRSENVNFMTENTAIRREFDSARSSLADTRANLQEIQRDLDALKGKMEEVRYQLDRQIGQSTRAGDQRIKDMEGRIAKLDDDLKTQGALLKAREEEMKILREALKTAPGGKEAAASVEGAGPSEFARERLAGESEAVKRDYDEAWKLLERKDYRAAISRFKEFIKKNPQSEYADNAQYWIGESHYALREFDQAILEFDAVRRKYPKGDKVPAALLKQGFAFAELGDKVDARLILQELMDRFPQSQEAVKAKQKLKSLES